MAIFMGLTTSHGNDDVIVDLNTILATLDEQSDPTPWDSA